VVLVSVDDQLLIGELLNANTDAIGFQGTKERFEQAEGVLQRLVLYTEPTDLVQRVCNHPEEIIKLQKEFTDLKAQHCLPPTWDHSEMEN